MTYYKIKLADINNKATLALESIGGNIEAAANDQIVKPMREKVDEFYSSFLSQLENLKRDCQSAIEDQKKNQGSLEKILNFGENLLRELGNFKSEIDGLAKASKNALNPVGTDSHVH